VQARVAALRGWLAVGDVERVAAEDIRGAVDAAIGTSQPALALELVDAAAAAEGGMGEDAPPLVTAEVLQRLMTLAAYGQNLEFADRLLELGLQAPATRLDARIVELYVVLVGDLPEPDHNRALAFCNLVLELGHNAFAPYLASLTRTHGDAGAAGAAAALAAASPPHRAPPCAPPPPPNPAPPRPL